MQLAQKDQDFRKAVLKLLQTDNDVPMIMESLKNEVGLVLVDYVCGDRVSKANRIVRN